jgi:hypothetical protein
VCAESLNVGKLSRCEVGERGAWLEESHQPCYFTIGAKQRESRFIGDLACSVT